MPSGTMAQQIALRIWSERTRPPHRRVPPHLPSGDPRAARAISALHGLHAPSGRRRAPADHAGRPARRSPSRSPRCCWSCRSARSAASCPAWDELVAQIGLGARARRRDAHGRRAAVGVRRRTTGALRRDRRALRYRLRLVLQGHRRASRARRWLARRTFIAEARVWQRRHGGNLFHLYPYVLSARAGLRRAAAALRAAITSGRCASPRRSREVPGVIVKPNPPQTHMMHVYLRGDARRPAGGQRRTGARAAGGALLLAAPTDLPGYAMFELSVGDAAEALHRRRDRGLLRPHYRTGSQRSLAQVAPHHIWRGATMRRADATAMAERQ